MSFKNLLNLFKPKKKELTIEDLRYKFNVLFEKFFSELVRENITVDSYKNNILYVSCIKDEMCEQLKGRKGFILDKINDDLTYSDVKDINFKVK